MQLLCMLSEETYTHGESQNVLDLVPRAVSGAAGRGLLPLSPCPRDMAATRQFLLEFTLSSLPGPLLPSHFLETVLSCFGSFSKSRLADPGHPLVPCAPAVSPAVTPQGCLSQLPLPTAAAALCGSVLGVRPQGRVIYTLACSRDQVSPAGAFRPQGTWGTQCANQQLLRHQATTTRFPAEWIQRVPDAGPATCRCAVPEHRSRATSTHRAARAFATQ